MLHRLVRWLGRRALRWFYRDVRIIGADRIPPVGPVLLVGNHPNDLPDVLIGYLTTVRPVRFIATSAEATSVLVRWTYRGLGVIPVTRVRDALKLRERGDRTDLREANRQAFAAVTTALNDDAIVGLYPEGGVHAGPTIGTIRSGVARMVLDGCVGGGIEDVMVIPIGTQYEDPSRPRSAVMLRVGEPMTLQGWLRRNAPEHRLFTAELRRGLLTVVRSAATDAEAARRDRALAAMGGALADGWAAIGPGAVPAIDYACVLNEQWLTLTSEPQIATAIERIGSLVQRVRGSETSSNDCALTIEACRTDGAHPRIAGAWWRGVVEAPIGAIGWALHAPLWRAAWAVSHRVSVVPTDLAARTIVPGLYLTLVWYVLVTIVTALGLHALGASPWFALVMLIAVPRLGDAGMRWRDAIRDLGLVRRVRSLSLSDRAVVSTAAASLAARVAQGDPFQESAIAVQRSVSLTR